MSAWLTYVTLPGDRWDLIAYRHYGSLARTADLIAANRDGFVAATPPVVPMTLSAGVTLRIPVIEADLADPRRLPPWKRG